jgi:hypothetical protein
LLLWRLLSVGTHRFDCLTFLNAHIALRAGKCADTDPEGKKPGACDGKLHVSTKSFSKLLRWCECGHT